MWIPLAARVTPANTGDGATALDLLPEVAPQVRYVLGDTHYNTPQVQDECFLRGQILVASGHGRHPRQATVSNSQAVRALFHKLRSVTIENFNQQFKCLFDLHRPVPTKGLGRTQCWVLGAHLPTLALGAMEAQPAAATRAQVRSSRRLTIYVQLSTNQTF